MTKKKENWLTCTRGVNEVKAALLTEVVGMSVGHRLRRHGGMFNEYRRWMQVELLDKNP